MRQFDSSSASVRSRKGKPKPHESSRGGMNCSQAVWEVIQVEAACHGRLSGEDFDTDFLPSEAGRQLVRHVYLFEAKLLIGKDDLSCGHSGSPGQFQVRCAAERTTNITSPTSQSPRTTTLLVWSGSRCIPQLVRLWSPSTLNMPSLEAVSAGFSRHTSLTFSARSSLFKALM